MLQFAVFHFTGDSDHCLAHVINEVRVDGETVTIEWQATGNGAQNVLTRCLIRGLMIISPCKLVLYLQYYINFLSLKMKYEIFAQVQVQHRFLSCRVENINF